MANKEHSIIERHDRIDDRNLTGFFIIFALFVTGLVVNMVVASKVVMVAGLAVPASVFVWALSYPASDIVAEVYGSYYARKMVLGGFIGLCAMFFYFWLAVIMPPAPFWEGQEQFAKHFGASTRVIIASITSYTVTQFLDVYIFAWIRHKTEGKHLWIRNNVSTFISQTLANIIFVSIVFIGVLNWEDWWQLFYGNLTMRYIMVLSDTAIVYGAVYLLFKLYPELKRDCKDGGK